MKRSIFASQADVKIYRKPVMIKSKNSLSKQKRTFPKVFLCQFLKLALYWFLGS